MLLINPKYAYPITINDKIIQVINQKKHFHMKTGKTIIFSEELKKHLKWHTKRTKSKSNMREMCLQFFLIKLCSK